MFNKIKDTLSQALHRNKLYDFGIVVRDERTLNSFTEISMSVHTAKGKRFVSLGIRVKNAGSSIYSRSKIQDIESIRKRKNACERAETLLSDSMTDEDIKALPGTEAK